MEAQRLFGAPPPRHVVIDFEHRGRLPALVAMEHPVAGDDNARAVAPRVDKLAFPLAGP